MDWCGVWTKTILEPGRRLIVSVPLCSTWGRIGQLSAVNKCQGITTDHSIDGALSSSGTDINSKRSSVTIQYDGHRLPENEEGCTL